MRVNKSVIAVALTGTMLCTGFCRVSSAQERSADPLGDVAQDMKVAARWLSKWSTDALTQETQKDAVTKLDALIVELEKQARAAAGSQVNPNPNRPALDSTVRSGPGGMGKLHGTNDEGKQWAQLPPHERERILQSMTEGFPAHYQSVLAAYYKRLAEEKPLKADDSPAPASASKSSAGAAAVDAKTAPDSKSSSSPAPRPTAAESQTTPTRVSR